MFACWTGNRRWHGTCATRPWHIAHRAAELDGDSGEAEPIRHRFPGSCIGFVAAKRRKRIARGLNPWYAYHGKNRTSPPISLAPDGAIDGWTNRFSRNDLCIVIQDDVTLLRLGFIEP